MQQVNGRKLRCPRCGTGAPVSAGKCPSCGLPIYTKRIREKLGPDQPRPPRFLSGRFKQRRLRPAAARAKMEVDDFGGVSLEKSDLDLTPKRKQKHGEMPKATGTTDFYQLDGLVSIHDDELGEAEKSVEKPPVKPGQSKDDETPVGTMADFLMSPSENPEETKAESSRYFAKAEIKLELGRRMNETADHAKKPGQEHWKPEPAPEAEPRPLHKTPREGEYTAQAKPGAFWIKWALPQLVLLLLVVALGPGVIQKIYRLEGHYQAVFTDEGGRAVTCRTLFTPAAADSSRLSGFFECQLYPNQYSTVRVDEPRVLKPIMGDGKISYEGHYDRSSLNLTLLGASGNKEAGSVELVARFAEGKKKIVGEANSPLGQRGSVELTPLNIPE